MFHCLQQCEPWHIDTREQQIEAWHMPTAAGELRGKAHNNDDQDTWNDTPGRYSLIVEGGFDAPQLTHGAVSRVEFEVEWLATIADED